MHSAREIITVHVGGIGNNLGSVYWDMVSREHGMSSRRPFELECGQAGDPSVLFDESKSGSRTPRVISCDLQGGDCGQASKSSVFSKRLDSSQRIVSDEGSGNCYARSFHHTGPAIVHKAMDLVRRQLERCDSLQALQFFHSTTGGTGSGLTGLLMTSLREYVGSKSVFCSASFVPSPSFSDIVLETYNTVLSLQDLAEHCDMSLLFDADACTLKKAAECVAGLSSSLRIPGVLNADLRKIHTNLVPFKNAHFLLSSHVACGDKHLPDVCFEALSKEQVCLSVNPPIEGQTRYLATLLAFRGASIKPSEVDGITTSLQRDKSRFDPFFPDWVPNSVCTSISGGSVSALTTVTNSTAVRQFLDRTVSHFTKQFKAKSHVYVYEESGLHAEEMLEAKCIVEYISDQYREYSGFDDKITRNPRVPLTDDQNRILSELSHL